MVVSETPPETANGFGSMLVNLYSNFAQRFIFTNEDFNHSGKNKNYIWDFYAEGGTQNLIDCYEITELDINRIFRYIEFCL